MLVLAADIGGTNARLALAEAGTSGIAFGERRAYTTRDFPGVEAILRRFRDETGRRPDAACVGVAGPVRGGRCRMPNLSWEVDAAALARALDLPEVLLLNDFAAMAHSLDLLEEEDLAVLQPGEERPDGARALIGAGTGLGQAYVTRTRTGSAVHPSEGGHADFAARTEEEWGLRRWLTGRYGRASVERVVSGPGLVDAYAFLSGHESSDHGTPAGGGAEDRADPAAAIVEAARRGDDAAAERAVRLFLSAYGAAAGNLALTLRAEGGVYVAGGIARRLLDEMRRGPFLEAFLDKGRLSDFLSRLPVRVIVQPDAPLLGAARVAAGG